MLIIFFRAIILFITLVVVMRMMGKRQIGEMQPFEFIITLLIAELACVPMADVSIPLVYGVVSVLAVFILHQLMAIIEQSSQNFRRVFNGKPSVVINRSGVDIAELKRNNMDVSDLIESLRMTGNFTLDGVSYAIYEANGKLSVLPSEKSESGYSLPILVIADGKAEKNNLKLLGVQNGDVEKLVRSHGAKSIKDVDVLTIDGNGKTYMQLHGKKYETFIEKITECEKW